MLEAIQHARLLMGKLQDCLNINVRNLLKENMTRKLINPELERPISYNSYKYFVQHNTELAEAWTAQRQG